MMRSHTNFYRRGHAVEAKMDTHSPEFDINDHSYDIECIVDGKMDEFDINDHDWKIQEIVSDYVGDYDFDDKFSQWISNKDFAATITISD